jgi:predicted nucleic acid-binding protein
VTVVLDAWAVVAVLQDEPAAPQIEAAIADGVTAISSVNLGEVLYSTMRRVDRADAIAAVEAVRRSVRVIVPDWPTTVVAATIKAAGGLSLADAYCIATARALDARLWTGDPEIVARAGDVRVVDLR